LYRPQKKKKISRKAKKSELKFLNLPLSSLCHFKAPEKNENTGENAGKDGKTGEI
jgi:hypothetical protein